MSSILDAVQKNPERAGGGIATPPEGSEGNSNPGGGGGRRSLVAVLVVVIGLAVGAVAARYFGSEGSGGQGEAVLVAKAPELTPPVVSKTAVEMLAEADAKAAVPAAAEPAPEAASAKPASVAGVAAPLAKRPAPGAVPKKTAPAVRPSSGNAAAKSSRPAAVVRRQTPPPTALPGTVGRVLRKADAPAQPGHELRPVDGMPALAPPPRPTPPVLSAPTAPAPPAVVSEPKPAAIAKPGGKIAAAAPPAAIKAPAAGPVAGPGAAMGDADANGHAEALPPPEQAEEEGPALMVDTPPAGAPDVDLLFVMWAKAPSARMVSMRLDGGEITVAREGDLVGNMRVSSIASDSVDFTWTGRRFRVRVAAF